MQRLPSKCTKRRGSIAVLAAVFMVVMLGMIAFAVDIGYLSLAKTQLQASADSAALAAAAVSYDTRANVQKEAQTFAQANRVAGRNVQLNASDVEFGTWNENTRTFTPSASISNAVKVTVRTDANSGGATPLFFGRIFGKVAQEQSASAVATVNPRDIAFVVDLSRSMNFDTNPSEGSSTAALIQDVYNDFGFGAYPGGSKYVGQSLGIADSSDWVNLLTVKNGPLWQTTIPSKYRITKTTDANKTWKAYAWVMEQQFATLMPNLKPVPTAGTAGNTTSADYKYWKYYIDKYRSNLGYLSYLTLMMDSARDITVAGSYTPLSLKSSLCACPMHDWTVNGESFSFPPREMPTHAARRALISAIQVVRDRNQSISDVNQRDWVSIITFDSESTETVKWSLAKKDDYAGAMQTCRLFQACGGTGTEGGLDAAYNHIKPKSQGGLGRENADKIVVLLTDGQPNQKRSWVTTGMIGDFVSHNPSSWTNPATGHEANNWLTGGDYSYEKNAALMRTSTMRGDNWFVYAAGIGLACDYDFMDRVARMGLTADPQGQCPRGSGDPLIYETKLREIFENIITNPKLRIVK
jgi:Flp pilus assembly protein TadG